MATLRDFMPHVLPFVSGCPEITATAHLRTALSEWCSKTRCWTHQVRNLVATTSSRIPIPVPPGTVIHDIAECWLDGRRLEPVPFSDHDPDMMDGEGQPYGFTQQRPGQISLVPRGTGVLRLNVYLKPAQTPSGKTTIAFSVYDPDVFDGVYDESVAPVPGVLEVPDFILDQWGAFIGAGAAAWIKLIPNQPWTDPQGAAVHRSAFQSEMERNFSRNIGGQQRAPRRSRAHFL